MMKENIWWMMLGFVLLAGIVGASIVGLRVLRQRRREVEELEQIFAENTTVQRGGPKISVEKVRRATRRREALSESRRWAAVPVEPEKTVIPGEDQEIIRYPHRIIPIQNRARSRNGGLHDGKLISIDRRRLRSAESAAPLLKSAMWSADSSQSVIPQRMLRRGEEEERRWGGVHDATRPLYEDSVLRPMLMRRQLRQQQMNPSRKGEDSQQRAHGVGS